MTRVVITRAEPEASATAARITALGGEPILAPLLEIRPVAFDPSLEGVQALLFSSANGVRAFAAATQARLPRALCVGDATAGAARDAGFADVLSASGDSQALAALAAANLAPEAGLVLHISGRDVAGDLVAALIAKGFTAERRIAYAAETARALPEALQKPCDFILFHSGRAAETYRVLGAPHAAQTCAACLSAQVAEPLAELGFQRIIVAPYPREEALLHAILPPPGAIA